MSRTERREAKDFYFLQIPLPLADTKRVGRLSKFVWARIYTYLRSDRKRCLSARLLAEISGVDRRNLDRVVRELRAEGLLETRVLGEGADRLTEYRPIWPDWLSVEGERFLRTRETVEEKDSVSSEEEVGTRRHSDATPRRHSDASKRDIRKRDS